MNKWDELFAKGAKYKPLNGEFLDVILRRAEKIIGKKPKTAIDLGCGTGDVVLQFVEKGLTVTGIDFSEVAISKAKNKLTEMNLKAEFIKTDLNNLNLDKKADIIFCKFVLAFIEDKTKFLKSVKKMMRKNSVFILITPILRESVEYTKEDKPFIAVDLKKLKKLFKENFGKVKILNKDSFAKNGEILSFLIVK
jgi:ubiquinone/menaquinone biosynthesis C-methylase UbiE